MLKYIINLLTIFGLFFVYSCGKQEQKIKDGTTNQNMSTNNFKSPDDAAKKSLEDLKQLVKEDNFKEMGFGSVDEVKSLELGVPIAVNEISFEQLLNYNNEIKAEQMIKTSDKIIFPLISKGIIKSATTTVNSKGNWIIGSIGDAYLPVSFNYAKETIMKQYKDTSVKKVEAKLISIPSLNMDFAGMQTNNGWILTPLMDYPEANLTKERYIEAEKLMPLLSEYAKIIQKKYTKDLKDKKIVR